MSLSTRVKTVAGAAVAGTALSAVAMVGFAGTANAADHELRVCNNGNHDLAVNFGSSQTQFMHEGVCLNTTVAGNTAFQLHFKLNGGQEALSPVLHTYSDANTFVESSGDTGYGIRRY